ncbi:MAG: SdrD B-like domain-containing protein [Anaerolineae bacterium]
MTKSVGEIDHSVQQLLKETYGQVKPSPQFKQRLYLKLKSLVQARQRSAGGLHRVRALLADLAAAWLLWRRQRPALSLIVAVALLLLVGSVALAVLGGIDQLPWLGRDPERQVPAIIPTPTAAAIQSDEGQPATLAATALPERPASMPSLTAVPITIPTATNSPTLTSTPEPTATPSPTSTSTSRPTATTTPMPVSVEATSSSTPTQAEETGATPSPTATSHERGRIMGVAWVDANGNGRRDEGDQPLGGVSVALEQDATGQLLRTITTGADGRYEFGNLPAGRYLLHAAPPAGYQAITAQAWGVDLVYGTVERDLGYQYRPEE